MTVTRRDFLKMSGTVPIVGASSTLFPRWMPKMAFAPAGQEWRVEGRDVLVCIFLRGGVDGLNTVIPYAEGAHYYDRRPTIAIPEPGSGWGSAIDLNGFFGLHPALAPLKDIYDSNGLTIVQAAGSPHPTRSHFDAMEYMERGIPGDKITGTGWITRHLESALWPNESPFRAIGMGAMLPGSLRGEMSALALQSIADFHLGGRDDQLDSIRRTLETLYSVQAPDNLLSAQARTVMETVDLLSELAVVDYVPEFGAAYPDTEFGMGLRQTAQLIKADVGLEVSCIDIGGWDTHEGQGGAEGVMATQLDELARGLLAFYTDLGDRIQNVSVVTMSEFGRTTGENASGGTDHGRANAMFIMGGGAYSQVYARWPGLHPDALDEGDLAVTLDYRDILAEIVAGRLLNPAIDSIFPNYSVQLPGLITART